MIIRTMRQEDIMAVLAIDQSPMGSHWTYQQFKRFIEQKIPCYILESPGKKCSEIIGFIVFSVLGEESELLHLGVGLSCRYRGYGKRLLMFMLNDLKDRGVKKLFLEVRESNVAAIKLYESLGMQYVSRRLRYYDDHEDALVYQLFM